MKILILGKEIRNAKEIKCYTDMWSFFLVRAFISLGVDIKYQSLFDAKKEDEAKFVANTLAAAKDCDAILSIPIRYFTTIPKQIGLELRRQFKGWVAQIYDGSMLDSAPVDITFTVRDDTWRYVNNKDRMERHLKFNKYVGWAANSNYFYPENIEKNNDGINIFIDHSAFDETQHDYTLTFLMNLKNLKTKYRAKTLGNDGIVDVDINNINVRPYNRKSVSIEEFSKVIRNSDIFIVTHKESLGLCVLEAAMCGALVLTFPNCIVPDRLELVNHVQLELGKKIDWELVINKLNKKDNYEKVKHFTWEAVAIKMLSYLVEPKRFKW